jgi:HEAT repeat protein
MREVVIQESKRMLGSTRWRALEQAAMVLTLLDFKPAAPRLIELLQFERPEVYIAAAWGLRRLAVPETLPAQLREIERRCQTAPRADKTNPLKMIDIQVAQLAQSLGAARYAPADRALRRFVPKGYPISPESRRAAIWALGMIHEKKPPADLVEAFVRRLTDEDIMNPEDRGVRRMAAISLGRMKAEDALPAFRRYYHGHLTLEPMPNACGWALEQVTGEKLPASGTVEMGQRGWFLDVID